MAAAVGCLLESLPAELLSQVLCLLSGPEVSRAGRTCRRLREAAGVDGVWRARCRAEFGVEKITSDRDVTYYELYTKILYKYGRVIGVWQPDVGPYGGLFVVKFTGDCIEGIHAHPPTNPHVHRPLRLQRVFSVELDAERRAVVRCHGGHNGPHPCELQQIQQEGDVFSSKCASSDHHRHPQGEEAEFSEWLSQETDNDLQNFLFHGQELLRMKFRIKSQFEVKSNFVRLYLPQPDPRVFEILPPGVFKGGYGCHGIELLSVSYTEGHQKITVRKISGDPNVPAGQVSIEADLSRPMVLSDLQQASVQTLKDIDTPDIPADVALHQLPSQPFRVPADCLDRDTSPKTRAIARFHTKSQIAGQGFSNPSFIAGHFIVFDADTFGHIWLDLRSFSLYSRVKEDLSTGTCHVNVTGTCNGASNVIDSPDTVTDPPAGSPL